MMSLFEVDMVGCNGENVKEHIYPDSMEEFVSRICIVRNIGELNEEIIPTRRDPNEEVHIGGDYKALVPQNLIRNNHISYQSFVDEVLKPKIVETLGGKEMVRGIPKNSLQELKKRFLVLFFFVSFIIRIQKI